ncbi:hypothetical protein DFH07DRAFT_968215 [Mycena maculata]|uniref:Uncharacterized protein n=1 Tax=Mycena maculata TaxID=230809 RepID=A0AAD7MVX4_9AGAR|nr:hypothetical protein DFH07DRAFT_968215 [Mycena maculata]
MVSFRSLITLLTLFASFCVVQGRYYTTRGRRQDTSTDTLTYILEDPSPTLTQAAIQSAYSVYVQACGSDLDAYAYSELSIYRSITGLGGIATAQITDTAFMAFMDNSDGVGLQPFSFRLTEASN